MSCTALFVDDDQAVLDSIKTNLHSKFSIATATDPRNVIQALESGKRFAVVVSDFKMPGMDGITFLSRVRDLAPDTARVMLTGHADVETASKAVNEGSLFRFLVKPCSPQDIASTLNAGMDHHRLVASERELRQRMEMIISGTASGTWDMDMDAGEILVDETWSALLGDPHPRTRRVGAREAHRLVHPHERGRFASELRKHLDMSTPHFSCDVRMRQRAGTWRWMRICGKITARGPSGRPLRMSGIMSDINEEMLAKQALADQISFLDELIDAFPYPIFVKSADARFVSVNCAYERFFGTRRQDVIGKSATELGHHPQADMIDFQAEDQRMLHEFGTSHQEVSFELPGGRIHHCLHWSHAFRHEGTGERGFVGTIVDISEQKRIERALAEKNRELTDSEARLKELSLTDELTGLANRRNFQDRVREALSLAARHGHPVSLMMADLDHFKYINDIHGHDAGDRVLQGFAKILRSICRKGDTPCRIGGEEFVTILPVTGVNEAAMLGARVVQAMRDNDFLGVDVPVTVSIGVAQYEHGECHRSLLERADQALYKAKKQGRNRVCS